MERCWGGRGCTGCEVRAALEDRTGIGGSWERARMKVICGEIRCNYVEYENIYSQFLTSRPFQISRMSKALTGTCSVHQADLEL